MTTAAAYPTTVTRAAAARTSPPLAGAVALVQIGIRRLLWCAAALSPSTSPSTSSTCSCRTTSSVQLRAPWLCASRCLPASTTVALPSRRGRRSTVAVGRCAWTGTTRSSYRAPIPRGTTSGEPSTARQARPRSPSSSSTLRQTPRLARLTCRCSLCSRAEASIRRRLRLRCSTPAAARWAASGCAQPARLMLCAPCVRAAPMVVIPPAAARRARRGRSPLRGTGTTGSNSSNGTAALRTWRSSWECSRCGWAARSPDTPPCRAQSRSASRRDASSTALTSRPSRLARSGRAAADRSASTGRTACRSGVGSVGGSASASPSRAPRRPPTLSMSSSTPSASERWGRRASASASCSRAARSNRPRRSRCRTALACTSLT